MRAEARVTHSRQLERLAQKMAAHLDGPFADLINMVEKKFSVDGGAKGRRRPQNWRHKEISKAGSAIRDNMDKIAELTAKTNAADASVQKRSNDIDHIYWVA